MISTRCAFAAPALLLTMAVAIAPATALAGTTSQNQVVQPTALQVAALEAQNRELRYQADIDRIRADLIEAQTSWFEIVVGCFGLLVTVLLIYFGWRFGREAVTAAKAEVALLREPFDQKVAQAMATFETQKADFDRQIAETERKLSEAEALIAQIRTHEQTAREITAGLAPGETPTDPAQQKSLREIAVEAQAKPRADRTADDYSALVIVAAMDKDWNAMERRATALAYLFEDADPEALSFALFNKAYALGQLDRSEEAVAIYAELIDRFGESDDPALQREVGMAQFNMALRLGKLNRPEDEIAAYDDLIARFGESDNPALCRQVAVALLNKGVTLGTLGRPEEEIATYDDLIARFGNNDYPPLNEQVESALFNSACARARIGDAPKATAALRTLAEHTGGFDCAGVSNENDFDAIRSDPAFQALLREYGCLPPEQSQP